LREQLEGLIALQIVDLKIQEMERARGEIPQLMASLEEVFKKEEEKVQMQRAEMEKLQKERRQKEKDLEEEIGRVKKTEARVFEIKTNKEYQAVLKEIESAKKTQPSARRGNPGNLERSEEMQENLIKGEKELEARRKEIQRRINELQMKVTSFDEEMAGELRQRAERVKKIPADILSKYRLLFEKRQGVAVARVNNGVCLACNMNLRPQLYIELQKQDTLILCPNCSRIFSGRMDWVRPKKRESQKSC